jgi:tyrosine-protein kinase Etk/Wzc
VNNPDKKILINKDFNPFILQSVLTRYWYWPIVFIIVMVTLAFTYLRYTKSLYESMTIVQIEDKDQGKEILAVENINKSSSISKEIELLKSELLFEKAVQKLNMNVSLFSKGKILTEELYHSSSFNVQPYFLKDSSLCGVPIYVSYTNNQVELSYLHGGNKKSVQGKLDQHIINEDFDVVFKSSDLESLKDALNENQLYFIFNSPKELIQRLLPNLMIQIVDPEAKTIQISYRSYNPKLCNDIVDVVTKAFFEFDEENKKKSADNILRFIDIQLDSLTNELRLSKDSLTRYIRAEKMPDPDGASGEMSLNINRFQEQLFVIEDELSTLQLVSSKLKADPNRLEVYRLLPEMLGKSYESSLTQQIEDLHQILEKKEDLLVSVTPENNEIKNINGRIATKMQSIRRSMAVIQERLIANARVLKSKIGSLDASFLALPQKKMEFNRLKSLQDLNEKYFTLLTEKKIQYSISNAGYSPTNRVLSKPFVPLIPVSPNGKMIYISFFLFGLLLGLSIIIIKYLTFNEINNLEDLKKLLPNNISFLGGVPIHKKKMEFSQVIVHNSSRSMIAESLRSIRANMSFVNNKAQVIAISSSISGEGKTFVALNLAGIIAMSGKKTIVIDLDLRKPKVHLGFNAINDFGVSNLIIKETDLDACIHHSEVENLDFITAGPIPPNPSELILSDEFKNILEELKAKYDMIIIDNPPVGLVSDGIQILANADIPIYIFKANYSKRNFAERVKELFEVQQLTSLNVILNGIEPIKRRYGYGYGYGYGYSYGFGNAYGSGYYADEEEIAPWYKRIFSWRKKK